MGILRYSDGEMRELLRRAVSIRWPGEDLLIVTSCLVDPPRSGLFSGADGLGPGTQWGNVEAVLAATRSRLIYQERTTLAILLRTIGVVLSVTAVVALVLGSALTSFAAIGLCGLAVWAVAKLTELFTIGSASIDYQWVDAVDGPSQRIQGIGRSGALYRLRVPDPSDFHLIVSLVGSYGQTAA
jgi:hypothetical protein